MRPAPMFVWPTSEFPIWPGGKSDRLARCDQLSVRIAREQLVVDGRSGQRDGVVVAFRANAEAVQDEQDERGHRISYQLTVISSQFTLITENS